MLKAFEEVLEKQPTLLQEIVAKALQKAAAGDTGFSANPGTCLTESRFTLARMMTASQRALKALTK